MRYHQTRMNVMQAVKRICKIAQENDGCDQKEAFRAIKEKYGASEKMIKEFLDDYGFVIVEGWIKKGE